MDSGSLTMLNQAKRILGECACFQGPEGPPGPPGTITDLTILGASTNSLLYYTGTTIAGTSTLSYYRGVDISLNVFSVTASIIPPIDNLFTLGAPFFRWKDLYVGPSSIHLGNKAHIYEDVCGNITTNHGFNGPNMFISTLNIGSNNGWQLRSIGSDIIATSYNGSVFGSPVSILYPAGYISTSGLTSTIDGLGSAGYISSSQLTSTIDGLGSADYISSSQLISTVVGLGSGSASGWSAFPALQTVYLSGNTINMNSGDITNAMTINTSQLYLDTILASGDNINFSNFTSMNLYQNGPTTTGSGLFLTNIDGIHGGGITFDTTGISDSYIYNDGNGYLNVSNINGYPILFQTGIQVDTIGSNMNDHIQINSHLDLQDNNISNVNILQTDFIEANYNSTVQFANSVDMSFNQISNIQVNYSNTFSNTSIVPSLLSASPQTFSGAIYDQPMSDIFFHNTTTGSESNYLYFNSNQTMWKIHITMSAILNGYGDNNNISLYFTLSNSTSAIETPLQIYTSNSPFTLYTLLGLSNINISINDTVNLSDMLGSSINPYTPICLNMYIKDNDHGDLFVSSNIGTWTNPINLSGLTIGYGVAYGNNTWIVVGYGNIDDPGYMATSYDNGQTWVGTSLTNFTIAAYCVAYGNGVWVIGCDTGSGSTCLLYSTDGTNFRDSGAHYFSQTRGVAYGNGVFVATGAPNYPYPIVYSTDGIHWAYSSTNPSSGGLGVTYANGLFVVVGDDHSGGLLTSQDGINWQQYNVATYLVCAAYGAGSWFVSDGGGNIYTSADNWYSSTQITEPYTLSSLAFGDTFVGIDANIGIYSSPNFGTTWNTQNSSLSNGYGIAYGNGMYVACGYNGGYSNCILIASATNTISYSLEPATIQPQSNVLAAPTIDWANTYYDGGGNLVISWFTVPGATHYKIFLQIAHSGGGGTHYVNKYGTKAANVLNHSLSGNMFNSDSGALTGNSYSVSASSGDKNNYFVFAYNNGVRSAFPNTQILDWNGILELWPVEQCEFHGGTNRNDFTSVTARNLYTNKCMVVSSNDWFGTFGNTQLSQLGLDTYLSNH